MCGCGADSDWVTTCRMLLVSFDEASWEGCHIHSGSPTIILFVVRQTNRQNQWHGTACFPFCRKKRLSVTASNYRKSSPTPDPVRARFASKDCCASSKMSGKQAARFRGSIWRLRRDTYRQGCPDRVCMAFAVSKKQERLVTFNRSQRNRGAFTSSIDSEKLSASSPAFRSSLMTCGPEQQTSHSSKRGTRKMPSEYYKMHEPGISRRNAAFTGMNLTLL
jgi:hypothetical protein